MVCNTLMGLISISRIIGISIPLRNLERMHKEFRKNAFHLHSGIVGYTVTCSTNDPSKLGVTVKNSNGVRSIYAI